MKKKAIILISFLAVMSFTACSKMATGINETPAITNPGDTEVNPAESLVKYMYSSEYGQNEIVTPNWGSGSAIVNKNSTKDTYTNTIEIATGTGWGGTSDGNAGVLALSGLKAGTLSGKDELVFTFKADVTGADSTENIEIQMPGGGTTVTAYSTGVNCKSWTTANGWHTVTINMADFGNVSNVTDIVFIVKDDTAQNMYFTNIGLKKDNIIKYVYSSEYGQNEIVTPNWGSGSAIVNKNSTKDTYTNTIEIATGTGWGGTSDGNAGVLALSGLKAGTLSGKDELVFTFKADVTGADSTENIEIQMPGGGTTVTAYSTGVNCKSWTTANGWHTVTINMADFGNVSNVTDIVFIVKDDTMQHMYFTDIAVK